MSERDSVLEDNVRRAVRMLRGSMWKDYHAFEFAVYLLNDCLAQAGLTPELPRPVRGEPEDALR